MRRRERGVALLMAMLVVSIATVTAVSLVHDQAFSIRKTGNQQQYNNSLMFALGLEDYARLFLNQDAQDSKTDHLEEAWAIGIPALPIDGGFLSGSIIDGQSRINVNNLVFDAATRQQLQNLASALDVSPVFISALVDWIDENDEAEIPDGAEDDYYTALENPYRSANRLMVDISELRLIKGIDAETYETLRPFLIALPENTPLNLNTMSVQVFDSLGLDVSGEAFAEERQQDAFESIADFSQRLDIVLDETQSRGLSVSSSFFRASGEVTLNEKSLSIHSLLKRGGQGQTTVVHRQLGAV